MNGTKKSVGALTVALAVAGSVVLLGSAAAGAVNGLRGDGPRSLSLDKDFSAPVATELKAEVSGADLTIEYYSGDEVQFEASGRQADLWKVNIDDGVIRVQSPNRGFDWFSQDWFGGDWSDAGSVFDWPGAGGGAQATLKLPKLLQSIDADLTLDAGSLSVDGDLGQVDAEVNAGALELDGSAQQFEVTVNAGQADVDLDGVSTGTFVIDAGRITSELTGQLSALTLQVSAGDLQLTLPDRTYDLRRSVTAGSFNTSLQEAPDSTHRIDARVTAGSVTLSTDDADD